MRTKIGVFLKIPKRKSVRQENFARKQRNFLANFFRISVITNFASCKNLKKKNKNRFKGIKCLFMLFSSQKPF